MNPSAPSPSPDPVGDGVSNDLPNPRSASRLAAVQALYQVELGGGVAEDIFEGFLDIHQGAALDGPDSAPADREFFRMLAQGVSDQIVAVDRALTNSLQNQTVERLDAILRAVLRVGAYELMSQAETPARVIISEYLDIAHAFFAGSEPKLVNGVLDNIAQGLRPNEFK
ncbi:MAG: transcription antitermination factor NusB [Alphaproteobacteria bacterium]|jgi:transcription antitermination protein NusB|nr:transcription antitermination factor NusB [Alphaproteobacteria bacterium]MBT4711750.1 transcription antitermination factor NusB [Alphaproteobacteria bacterium]